MKKNLILTAVMTLIVAFSYAQNYIVVNTEKIFKAVPAYVKAQESLENYTKSYQKTIDAAYADVEKMYVDYQLAKSVLSPTARQTKEDAIIAREKEIAKFQSDVFGPNGDIVKKRVELVKPIQDQVFEVINKYALQNNFGLVLDVATNPMVLFYAPATDKTEDIIKLINK